MPSLLLLLYVGKQVLGDGCACQTLLATELVASFSLQILHDVHKDGRSHRDIKPHNIVVSWKNGKVTVTLIDWAGSRLRGEGLSLIHI